jgi:hypothetical protein
VKVYSKCGEGRNNIPGGLSFSLSFFKRDGKIIKGRGNGDFFFFASPINLTWGTSKRRRKFKGGKC